MEMRGEDADMAGCGEGRKGVSEAAVMTASWGAQGGRRSGAECDDEV